VEQLALRRGFCYENGLVLTCFGLTVLLRLKSLGKTDYYMLCGLDYSRPSLLCKLDYEVAAHGCALLCVAVHGLSLGFGTICS
jgi:hypothetical protein